MVYAIITDMKLKLVKVKKEAEDTKSFFWEPEKKVNYLPGQFFYFTLPKLKYKLPRAKSPRYSPPPLAGSKSLFTAPPRRSLNENSRGPTRHFTLSSSPTEGEIIRFTTRMRAGSGLKRTLGELKINSEIEGEGPNGTFILDERETGPHVFLAGGIGITPFRSIIKYYLDKNLPIPMHFIYSNGTPGQITFRKELEKWAKGRKNLKVDMTITRPDEGKRNLPAGRTSRQEWEGLTGRIDEEMIKKLVSNLSKPTFWITGPPGFVEAMETVLGRLGITSDKIRSEKFTGY
jgi:ferredoxin-NADP reductase